MSDRASLLPDAKRIVVKLGTGVLTSDDGHLDSRIIARLVAQVDELKAQGREIVLVTSAAISAGWSALGLSERPTTLPELQAAAAVGQNRLMTTYEAVFDLYGHRTAQILLTRQDFEDRVRYLNAGHTIRSLLGHGAIPIINENDTVAVEEIRFGDNDVLSASVTNLVRADLLVMLTGVDGLHAPDPSGGAPLVVDVVERISEETRSLVDGSKSERGLGGMETKLDAAAIACSTGATVVIANGRTPEVLPRILKGEQLGTLFLPSKKKMSGRKGWIGFTAAAKGKIFIDDGAQRALVKRGKSLLASGVTHAEGAFSEGDVVELVGPDQTPFARGLCNYSASEVLRVKGAKTSQMAKILGYRSYDELVHRDNMVILTD